VPGVHRNWVRILTVHSALISSFQQYGRQCKKGDMEIMEEKVAISKKL
jgi:hypothetical protein